MHVQHPMWALSLPLCPIWHREIFQRVMLQVVQCVDGCEATMDDIAVWGKVHAELEQRLKETHGKGKVAGS